jgi:hypothetical protein
LVNIFYQKAKISNVESSSPPTQSSPIEPPTLTKMASEKKEDDDAPYTPWEEEEEEEKGAAGQAEGAVDSTAESPEIKPPVLVPEVSPPVSEDVQKQLQELEARIEKERQDIEKITGALAGRSSTSSGIPGLDGEFPENETTGEEDSKSKGFPFFLQSEDKKRAKSDPEEIKIDADSSQSGAKSRKLDNTPSLLRQVKKSAEDAINSSIKVS